MKPDSFPSTTALAGWYGSNRSLAHEVGKALTGCAHVTVPFAGGMCELAHITARTIVVSDLHRHIVNLATAVADPDLRLELFSRLKRLPLHPSVLEGAQRRCLDLEHSLARRDGLFPQAIASNLVKHGASVDWAADYFVCCWMAVGGAAGTRNEFSAPMSLRMDAGGGDSAVRYRSALRSLVTWTRIMRRCSFTVDDAFDVLPLVKDAPKHGVYVDPPFPGPGDKYTYPLNEAGQRRLAKALNRFSQTRVVARFYDHPLIRELYPAGLWSDGKWQWKELTGGKDRGNKAKPEILLIKNGN